MIEKVAVAERRTYGLQEEDDLSLGTFYLHQTDLPPLHLLLASLLVC